MFVLGAVTKGGIAVKINYDVLAAMAPYFVLAVTMMGIVMVAIWAIKRDVRLINECRNREMAEFESRRESRKCNVSGRGQKPLTPKSTILEDPINDNGRPRKRRKKIR